MLCAKAWGSARLGVAGVILVGGLVMLSHTGGQGEGDEGAEVLLSLDRPPGRVVADCLAGVADSVDAVQYKFTDPGLLDPLRDLLEEGVQIRLLLDGREAARKASLWRPLGMRTDGLATDSRCKSSALRAVSARTLLDTLSRYYRN